MITLNLQLHEPLQPTPLQPAMPGEPAAEVPAIASRPNLPAITESLRIGLGNRYEVLDPLAIGGMSTVLQLRHRLHGGLFVAKVLHAWLASTPAFLTRFRVEAMHGVALSGHPHVATILDLGEIDGLIYLLMPYIDGEDLDRVLERTQRLARAEALTLVAHMASVLLAAEQRGIVHCDISPGNIRLDRFSMYRLMDFGLSQNRESIRGALPSDARTPLYASPEQWRGEELDTRSDLYSLGAVLCEVLTGVPPFLAGSETEIRRKHLEGDWSMPTELEADAQLSHLLLRLLATNREDRMRGAVELGNVLAAIGFPITQLRVSPPTKALAHKTAELRNRLTQLS